MNRSTKEALVGFVVGAAVAFGLSVALSDSNAHASQEGERGFWTASQKANAIKTLTSYPVSESPALADCVIAQVSQQHSFTEFLQYATMASLNDFSNPNQVQTAVINSLMFDALTCPQAH